MLQGLAKALKELQALVNSKASLNGLALAKALKRQNELRLDLGMGSKNKPVERKQIVADDVAIQAQKLNGSPVANIDENTLNMPKEGGFKAITEWGKQIFNSWGGKANNPVLGEVILNEQSIRDSLSHDKKFNPYKGFALASVKDVVEKGSIIHTDYNTPGEDSFYIAAPVLINGNRNIVTVLVHRDVNTQRMYLHYVGLEENLKQSHYKQTAAQDKESRKHNRNATASDIANILQNALNYKQDNAELTNNKQDGWDGNDKIPQNSQPFNRSNIKIPKSIKARQNANNQAMAILDRLDGGELSVDDLTDDDKAVLAKYSGNGGGLIGRDGKKGSDYEYYTPHELASGMWDLAKELGFNGGRVLDPCAGTGVFTATSPDNVLMDNIELDETSGRINQILNDGVRAKTTISPFEKVVNGYDDGDDETGFDLVMSNVPFGNNAARGANKMYDKAYQDASLDYYFILRSLEKLKSGGLAVLMTAPSTVQGKRAKEIELRQKTSRIAEFIGAYRLPNSMFTDTGADVSVDVMVFKKFNQSMIETVQNHYDNGNIELLQQANVLWDDYLSGHYFKKHPKNVLGTIQKAKNRFGDDIEVVQSELSKSQIAKLMVKLGGSRIDWDLLNATEAKPITYQNGDVVYRGGVQYQYQHGTWQEMTQAGDDIRHHDTLAKLQDNAMNVSYDDIKTALAYFAKKGVVNEQINDAKVLLSNIKDGVEWRIYHTSKAIDSVLAQAEIGANLKEIYPGLSDEMRDVVVLAKGRYQGVISNALKNIKLHYNKGDYSDVWNGNIQTQHDTLEVTGTLSAKIAKLQYNNKSKYLSIDDFKAIAPDVDLMTDDDYFITKDGKQVVLASDFLVGNCKERLDELQNWIDECDDEALKTKLSRQYVMASLQIPNVDIYKASFDLLSPQIPMSFKMDFLNSVMPIKIALDGKGLKMVGQAKSNSEKIANRILYNINGNRLTLGGIELTDKGEKMNEKQALKLLNETFLQYNAQFKSWVKANDTLIDLLDSKINSLQNCYFSQNDDESELDIHGFNVKLHGYQNAFVRQQGRSFGGLNGFGVGLGKTFTSLASVQHTQNIGAKKKTIFVVPKSVLSNWRKEAMKAYASLDDCLFVGLREVRGKMVAKSSEYDADLQKALSREYRKIFMTQEAFQRIKLQDDTLDGYFTHLAQNDDIYDAQESE